MFLTLTVAVEGDTETQSGQSHAQGCPQAFAVIHMEDKSSARLGLTQTPTTKLEKPLSIKPPEKAEILQGFTSALFKVGEYRELARGREAQKTYAGRCVPL